MNGARVSAEGGDRAQKMPGCFPPFPTFSLFPAGLVSCFPPSFSPCLPFGGWRNVGRRGGRGREGRAMVPLIILPCLFPFFFFSLLFVHPPRASPTYKTYGWPCRLLVAGAIMNLIVLTILSALHDVLFFSPPLITNNSLL